MALRGGRVMVKCQMSILQARGVDKSPPFVFHERTFCAVLTSSSAVEPPQLPQFAVAPAIRFLGAPVAPSDLCVLCMAASVLFRWLYLTATWECAPCLLRVRGVSLVEYTDAKEKKRMMWKVESKKQDEKRKVDLVGWWVAGRPASSECISVGG